MLLELRNKHRSSLLGYPPRPDLYASDSRQRRLWAVLVLPMARVVRERHPASMSAHSDVQQNIEAR